MKNIAHKFYKALIVAEEFCSKALLILIVALTFLAAVVRYFDISWTWSLDLVLLLFAWFSFFASSQAIRRRSAVNMSILVDRLPQKLQQIIAVFNGALMVAFMASIIGYTFYISRLNWRQSITSLGISYSWILLALAIGGILMELGLIVQFGQDILILLGRRKKSDFYPQKDENGGDAV